MSSVETKISEIEDAFLKLVDRVNSLRRRKSVSESEALELFVTVVDFQRKMEYHKEAISIFSGRPYFERTMESIQSIIDYFSTEDKLVTTESHSWKDCYQTLTGPKYCDYMEGIVYETKQVLERVRCDVQSAVQRSLCLIFDFLQENVRTSLIELYGDLRLLASLVIFPIEQKMKTKDQLLNIGFEQVVQFLEIAEQNYALTPPHLRDTLANCRNALEATITLLLTKINLKPVKRFSMDVGTLSKSGLLDEETKKVVLSIWSYLSMKGSHSYSKVTRKNISDVDFGLEQTYRIIDQLLTKYQTYMKNKGSTLK